MRIKCQGVSRRSQSTEQRSFRASYRGRGVYRRLQLQLSPRKSVRNGNIRIAGMERAGGDRYRRRYCWEGFVHDDTCERKGTTSRRSNTMRPWRKGKRRVIGDEARDGKTNSCSEQMAAKGERRSIIQLSLSYPCHVMLVMHALSKCKHTRARARACI